MNYNYLKNFDDRFGPTEQDRLYGFDGKMPKNDQGDSSLVLNSLRYRSEEFVVNPSKVHMLFAGCSNTFGTGISDDSNIWPNLLASKLSEDIGKEIHAINIGREGASFNGIISLILRYIDTYGKPDTIFIMFPDVFRGIRLHQKLDGYYDAVVNPDKYSYHNTSFTQDVLEIIDSMTPYLYETYSMFEKLMELYGINLVSTSYNSPAMRDIFNKFNFKTFYNFDDLNLESYLYDNDDGSPNYFYAEDGAHWGTGFHKYAAELMYNKYHENN